MISRFISGGAIDASSGEAVTPSSPESEPTAPSREQQQRLAEWEAVQRDLAAERRAREEARRAAAEGPGEPSLYATLQANKAAKQAAFEEKARLGNQFRGVDEDEVEWLEGVREEQRGVEERLKRETEEGLEAFRKEARKERESKEAEEEGGEEWAVAGRKRKRKEEKGGLKGIKRTATAGSAEDGAGRAKERDDTTRVDEGTPSAKSVATAENGDSGRKDKVALQTSPPVPKEKPKVGLVAYGSDDSDEDDD